MGQERDISGKGSTNRGIDDSLDRALTGTEIRDFAGRVGIHAIGWFSASDFPRYLAAIHGHKGYHRLEYRSMEAFLKAGHIPEGIRTVIVLVMDYFVESNDRADGYGISNYARACWSTVGPKTGLLAAFLAEQGFRAERLDVPQRAAACRAGLGFIGRNAMFYAHGLGSYVGIASIGTDVDIEDSAPGHEQVTDPRCENCGRCIAACPVAAILTPGYRIDPMRCLSMLNRHPDEPERITPRKPEQLSRWLYGCETCQDVCPINMDARHRHDAVVPPEVTIEGLVLANKPTVSGDKLRSTMVSSDNYSST